MTEIRADILAALRTQEAALLAVLETVRQAIQTVLAAQSPEVIQGLKTETTDAERRLMNQVLSELGVQFTSKDIFERAKKLKPGMKRDFLKRAVIRLELSGAKEIPNPWRSLAGVLFHSHARFVSVRRTYH